MDSHQNIQPQKTSNKGCAITGVVVGVLLVVAVAVVAVFGLFWSKNAAVQEDFMHHAESVSVVSEMAKFNDDRLTIQESELAGFLPDFDGELSEKHFIAVAMADDATSLSKKVFAEKANGLRVEWTLKVSDIKTASDTTEEVEGRFELPYMIYSGNSGSGSSIYVDAQFTGDAATKLIAVRRGQWIKIAGDLKYTPNNNTVTFENAELLLSEPVEVE